MTTLLDFTNKLAEKELAGKILKHKNKQITLQIPEAFEGKDIIDGSIYCEDSLGNPYQILISEAENYEVIEPESDQNF